MRVLMISIDRTLLGADYSGDALARHQEYAQKAGQLDIIVLSKKGFRRRKISPELSVYPTNSSNKLLYVLDAFNIAREIYWPEGFDLIVTQDPFLTGLAGWILKKRFQAPVLMHFHGDFWQNRYWLLEKGRWWFNWFFLILSKFLVDGADGLRVTSSGIKRKLVKSGVPTKKIRVIPTPVDLNKFIYCDVARVKRLRKKYQGRKILINVGRDDPSKDYRTLYRAISLVYDDFKKLALLRIGKKEYLREKIKSDENLLSISLGKIKQERLSDYYHASDIYISSSCHESFGKVLIEAMAAGLPVVATATTGSKEIVANGQTGFLVPIGDASTLARKILYLLNNPGKAREMGFLGRRAVKEKFGRQKVIDRIMEFWHDLAGLSRPRAKKNND